MASVIRAPEFPEGSVWLNTVPEGSCLRFGEELKGRVVLLDFWTYCCVNCMHVLPDLAYLEEKYGDRGFVVVGVHSNKFAEEGKVEAVRAAVARYGVRHPVVIDDLHRIWDSFAIRAWPTLVVVGADGRVVGQVSGEGKRKVLEVAIGRALAEGEAKGILKGPLERVAEHGVTGMKGLSFPGKVLADAGNRRLVIVDSNHHRVLVTTWPKMAENGGGGGGGVQVLEVIGTGEKGGRDGGYLETTFHRPQGATLGGAGGNVLFIADTENHLVRRVDLEKRVVTTVLGNGRQKFDPEAGKSGREAGLNSPWDVALMGNRLYVSQAGQHQIVEMNVMTGMVEVSAGSGREGIRDTEAGGAVEANLAQPSGMVLDRERGVLYFADSETSAVRGLALKSKRVFTLVGQGLFVFGDADGDRETARLQHPLGVGLSLDGKGLWVADTYNHKIKCIELESGVVRTVVGGSGGVCLPGGEGCGSGAEFFEPAGVVEIEAGVLLVADTNNHRIVWVEVGTGRWGEVGVEWGVGRD